MLFVLLNFLSLHGMDSVPCRGSIDIALRRPRFFEKLRENGVVLHVDTQTKKLGEPYYLDRLHKKHKAPVVCEVVEEKPACVNQQNFFSLPFLPDITGLDEHFFVAAPVPPHKATPRYRPPMRRKPRESIVPTDQ